MTHPTVKHDPCTDSTAVRFAGPAFVAAFALAVALTIAGPHPSGGDAAIPAATATGFEAEHPIATRIVRPPARLGGPAR